MNRFLNKKKREGRVSSLFLWVSLLSFALPPFVVLSREVSFFAVIEYGDCWFTFIYRKAEFLAVGRSFDDRSYALNLRALCILPKPL